MIGNHSIGPVPRAAIVLLALCRLAAGAHAVTIATVTSEGGDSGTTVTVTGTQVCPAGTVKHSRTFPRLCLPYGDHGGRPLR
jgi:hypothetical protein